MRLTVDLISSCPQSINATKDRMIAIRGCKIGIIENLGGTRDHFDCIDLTDNEIFRLANIPPLKRLKTFILANNRISRIADDVISYMPNLTSLVLTNNKIDQLGDLIPLFKSKTLTRLSLLDNPVTAKQYYREVLVFKISSLRFVDFKRITEKERKTAKAFFSGSEGASLFDKIVIPRLQQEAEEERREDEEEGVVDSASLAAPAVAEKRLSSTVAVSAPSTAPKAAVALTEEMKRKFKDAIAKTTTMEEVLELEKALASGVIPPSLLDEPSA